jgi:hypothetical protein
MLAAVVVVCMVVVQQQAQAVLAVVEQVILRLIQQLAAQPTQVQAVAALVLVAYQAQAVQVL